MSSDENNLIRSSSLSNRHLVETPIHSTEFIDEVVSMVDDVNQLDELLNDNTIMTTQISKCASSSKQSSRMTSPALSTSSQTSGRVITLLNHEIIQLPVDLERETLIKHNFDQLGKEKKTQKTRKFY